MVKVYSGHWETVWKPKVASTAFTKGQFVDLVSGFVQPSTSGSTFLMGVNQDSAIASSDATTRKIPVLVPKSKNAQVQVETSALVVGGTAYDLLDSNTVNQAATTNKVVRAVTPLSAKRAIFTINLAELA